MTVKRRNNWMIMLGIMCMMLGVMAGSGVFR